MAEGDFNLKVLDGTSRQSFGGGVGEFHTNLVYAQYQRVQEALSEEMVEGFWEEKTDKMGNSTPIFHRDTRKVAIERVLTLKNTMVADLTKAGKIEKINEITDKIKELLKSFLEQQTEWWEEMTPPNKAEYQRKNPGFVPTILNSFSGFYHQYLNEAIEEYRNLFELMELCLSESRYFERGRFHA